MITAIVARADNGVIGRDGKLPWHLPADLKRFRALTMGKAMVMGRKTFESLPGLLPGRRHVVLTRDGNWSAEGAEVATDAISALALAGTDAAIIGGAEVFALMAPHIERWELTEVHDAPDGETVIPSLDPALWEEIARQDHGAYSFVTLISSARA